MSRTPIVCQVIHALEYGGAEVLAARMARELGRSRRVVFACLDGLGKLGEALRDEGFPVEVIGRRPGLDLACARRLAAFLRREQVDLVHAHQYAPFFYALLARRIYRRAPILFTEHGRAFPDYPRPKRKLANRVLLERRDRVVAVGEAVRQALIDNEGLPRPRIEVIYNGIDLARLDAAPGDRAAVRAELGLPADAVVLAQVARLDALKDHRTAIDALAHALEQRGGLHLLVVGDGPEAAAIREHIERRGLREHVHPLGLRRDVGRLLAASDIGLLTSRSEGIPLALIEAMAAGLPVVSTDVGGVREVVTPGATGLLAPAADPRALGDAIRSLAADPDLRARLGLRARDDARARFSDHQMLDAYDALYDSMIPTPTRRTSALAGGTVSPC